ncbi:MAG: phosphatase PAP2 family protein [Litorilinea sp.]
MTEHNISVSRRGRLHMRFQQATRLDRRWSMGVALPDNPLDTHAQEYWAARVLSHLGDSWVWWLVAGLLWRRARPTDGAVPGWRGNPPWLTAGRVRLAGWLLTLLANTTLVMILKHTVQRPRPDSDRLLYGGGPDQFSFPSGHAARMGVLAVWAWRYGNVAGWFTSLLALLVCWTRVRLRIHYLSDVVIGLGIGAVMGIAGLVWRRHLHPKDSS